MPDTLSLYSFEDKNGDPEGCFTTMSYEEAEEHAQRTHCRIIENVYEWAEAVPVDGGDYTEHEEDDNATDPGDPGDPDLAPNRTVAD